MKKADLADNLLLARKDGFAAADVIGAAGVAGSKWRSRGILRAWGTVTV